MTSKSKAPAEYRQAVARMRERQLAFMLLSPAGGSASAGLSLNTTDPRVALQAARAILKKGMIR